MILFALFLGELLNVFSVAVRLQSLVIGVHLFLASFSGMKIKDLQKLLKQVGSNTSGTKQVLIESLASRINFLKTLDQTKITAIDIGTKNLAFITMDISSPKPKVLEWSKLSPNYNDQYTPINFCLETRKIFDLNFGKSFFLIERQTSTSSSWIGTPLSIQRCLAVEVLLISNVLQNGWGVDQISPRTISTYFDITSKKKIDKKKESVELVGRLLKKVEIDQRLAGYFSSQDKKDDLSDAFLIAYAFSEWVKAARRHL